MVSGMLKHHLYEQCPPQTLFRSAPDAVRTMLARAELEDALALRELAWRGDAVMIVDEGGGIVFATDRAWELARDYFPAAKKEGLPPELLKWVLSNPPQHAKLSRQGPDGQYPADNLWTCLAKNQGSAVGSAVDL
jgi:hypothetical protein